MKYLQNKPNNKNFMLLATPSVFSYGNRIYEYMEYNLVIKILDGTQEKLFNIFLKSLFRSLRNL